VDSLDPRIVGERTERATGTSARTDRGAALLIWPPAAWIATSIAAVSAPSTSTRFRPAAPVGASSLNDGASFG
jgi:hypothetical protein